MARWALPLFVLLAGPVWAQVAPPKGQKWHESAADGVSDAESRKTPILVFAGYNNSTSQTLTTTFEDPRLAIYLKHFSLVFIAADYNKTNFQQSYVPWLGSSAQERYNPPALVFGTASGPAQQFRIEAKALNVDQMREHLEKVLDTLAPAKAIAVKKEKIMKATARETCGFLESSLATVEECLGQVALDDMKIEMAWTEWIVKQLDGKLKKMKQKDNRKAANKAIKEMKKQLTYVKKARERKMQPALDAMEKAKQVMEQLRELSPNR